jgi:hypothetical protein
MVNNALNQLPRFVRRLADPVFGSLALANLATFGQAEVIYTLIVNSLSPSARSRTSWKPRPTEWVIKGTQS